MKNKSLSYSFWGAVLRCLDSIAQLLTKKLGKKKIQNTNHRFLFCKQLCMNDRVFPTISSMKGYIYDFL